MKICSVCKKEIAPSFANLQGVSFLKCGCPLAWKHSKVNGALIYEDADSPKPTMRFAVEVTQPV